jgi:phage terminase large subunit-like protein
VRPQTPKSTNLFLDSRLVPIAPTAADIRDVMVDGPSGLLAVAPSWCRPRFQPSKRRLTWPNGAGAICLSGEEPERARGLNVDTLWADELLESGNLPIHPRCKRLNSLRAAPPRP